MNVKPNGLSLYSNLVYSSSDFYPTIFFQHFINLDENGILKSVTINGKTEPLTVNFGYYKGAVGDNEKFENRSSGAYIFRPNGTLNVFSSVPDVTVLQGKNMLYFCNC